MNATILTTTLSELNRLYGRSAAYPSSRIGMSTKESQHTWRLEETANGQFTGNLVCSYCGEKILHTSWDYSPRELSSISQTVQPESK